MRAPRMSPGRRPGAPRGAPARGARFARRAALALLIILAVAAAALTGGLAWLVRAGVPQVQGTLEVPGLRAPVTVTRDPYGIPHIVASDAHDLAFAAGYVHAQDRLWQMDLTRRAIFGGLAEIFGPGLLDADKFLLALGLGRAAEAAWASPVISPETRAALEAYSEGVNAYIARARRLPLEFILLGYRPEPWTPVHSLGVEKYMAYDLAGNFRAELLRMALADALGPERARELWPAYPDDGPVILDPGPVVAGASPAEPGARAKAGGGLPARDGPPPAAGVPAPAGRADALIRLAALADQVATVVSGDPAGEGAAGHRGSNNWVIAGRHSASGRPLLANDPHLSIGIPSIWHQVHLVISGEMDVIGATFPGGGPAVVLGHNHHVAWGATNLAADQQDLYLLRVHPDDPTRYEVDGEWHEAEAHTYAIRVKGRPDPEPYTVLWTRFGPVITGAVQGADVPLALRWTAHDQHGAVEAIHRMNRARNWEAFREALRHFPGPIQNWVFAAADGTIAYKGAGRVPVRAPGHDGMTPVPGWTTAYDWQGLIPFGDLPEMVNPPAGLIVTANNRAVPDGYPYHLSHEWAPPHRAETILGELAAALAARGKLTLDDLAAIQTSSFDAHAAYWVPVLLQSLEDADLSPAEAAARDLLEAWDYLAQAGAAAPLVHHAWFVELARAALADELGEELFGEFLARGGAENVMRRLREANSGFFDDVTTPEREDFGAVARRAFGAAVERLTSAQGSDPRRWQWGRAHTITFRHPLGAQKPLDRLMNLGPAPSGGSRTTPGAKPYSLRAPFEVTASAPWRFLVDLGAPREARSSLAPGNSGVRGSPHYGDLRAAWLRGEYHPLVSDPDALAGRPRVRTLTLVPPAGGD